MTPPLPDPPGVNYFKTLIAQEEVESVVLRALTDMAVRRGPSNPWTRHTLSHGHDPTTCTSHNLLRRPPPIIPHPTPPRPTHGLPQVPYKSRLTGMSQFEAKSWVKSLVSKSPYLCSLFGCEFAHGEWAASRASRRHTRIRTASSLPRLPHSPPLSLPRSLARSLRRDECVPAAAGGARASI